MMRMEKGELAILIAKLDKIDDNLATLRSANLHMNQCDKPTCSANVGQPAAASSRPNTVCSQFVRQHEADVNLSTLRCSQSVMNMDVEQSSTDGGTDNSSWTVKENRKKRRFSTRVSPPYATRSNNGQLQGGQPVDQHRPWSEVAATQSADQLVTRSAAKNAQKIPRVVGKACRVTDSEQSILKKVKSARPYVKKLVFGVYNVERSETVATLEESIEQICGAKPITCFQIKSSREDSTAFRVCIDDSAKDKFLDEEMWSNGIVIRPWRFKPKDVVARTAGPTVVSGPTDSCG